IDLALDIRKAVVEILSQTLAASLDLKTQVKQAHWNVKGLNFYQLHSPEYPADIVDGSEHIVALAERYALYAAHLRSAIDTTGNQGDADTADLYTEISRDIDKRLWFLEAHLIKSEDVIR
ncbi:MAG: DNA starvation/stationary phase protection protein Dps, partial [Microcystis sp. 53602_E8]|nr:DNA starvation/stationary phase protection protein Dps [Microcystis sp. 53602_E8]